jgi:hypothetical protein
MNTSKRNTQSIITTPTCDICGDRLNQNQSHYLPTAEAVKLPYFWFASYAAKDISRQPLPGSPEAVMIYVLHVTGHDQGYALCHKCACNVFTADITLMDKWTNQTACQPGQAFWTGDMYAPILVPCHEDGFEGAYYAALTHLGLHLAIQAERILTHDEFPRAMKPAVTAYYRRQLEDLDFTVKTDPETGQFSLGAKSDASRHNQA